MARRSSFSAEVRDRAVRMVFDQQGQHASQWEAIHSISAKIGCPAEAFASGCGRAGWTMGSEAV